jgi:hypothetical protein
VNSSDHDKQVSAEVARRQKAYGTLGVGNGGSETRHRDNKGNAFGVENSRRKFQNVVTVGLRSDRPAIVNPGRHIGRSTHSTILAPLLSFPILDRF